MRMPWRRVARAIVPTTVLSLVVGVAVVAALADGYPTKDVNLHDGGVWVTKGNEALAGRFIVPIGELDAAVAINTTSVTELGLLQEGREVFINAGDGHLRRVNVSEVSLAEEGATIPDDAEVALGGGIVAVIDPEDGRLWVREAATVDSLDTANDPPDATVGGDAAVTVGRDGAVHAVSGDADRLVTARLRGDGRLDVSTRGLGAEVSDPSITAVGDRPVVLSGDGRLVVPGVGERVLPDAPEEVRLQQPGPASDVVAVATTDRLYGVPLGGGELELLSSDGTGAPAAPVQVGGCIYAAWSARPVMARLCRSGSPLETVDLGATGLRSDRLEFRVNYDLVVLNALTTGGIFTFERSGENLGHWENVKPPEPTDDEQDDKSSPDERPPLENTDPVAEPDEYGARPGQATLLPVLENDGDADHDYLVITGTTAIGDGARLSVVANGQALQLTLPPDASGIIAFTYTISDGRAGEDSARVTVTVRDRSENATPEPVKKPRIATVESGGTVTFHVLTDWRDPDGDPLVLVSAATTGQDEVRSTPDGFMTFVDSGVGTGRKTVQVQISDGQGELTEGTVEVEVLPRGVPSPPEPHDDRVVGFVGEPLTIEPLANDIDANVTTPRASPLRLTNVYDVPAGLRLLTRDFSSGKVIVTADAPRTYYLRYDVTQGTDPAQSARIRIDVQAASARNAPVAVADTVVLRGTTAGTVDVLANDTDLDGDVLVVSSVSVPERSGLVVSVLEHRWLRVIAPQALLSDAAITYTVSDGYATDVGVVSVNRVLVTENQAPSPRDDAITVRAGDVVTIDVLANDVDPEGGLLTLGSVIPDGDPKGQWYVTGDTVRYQAPATPGTATAHYKVLDPEGREADGRITVTIAEADPTNNQRPQPATLQARLFSGTVARIHVPLSNVDPDGDSVSLLGAIEAPKLGRIVGRGIDYLDYEAYPGKGGTDAFNYSVVDPFGATGTGVIRVGIIGRPIENSAPVAVDDEYEVAPGATVNAPVLANDSDVDGDALQLEALTVANPAAGDAARVADNRIVVTAPNTPGESISIPYAVTDGRGLRSFATLTVVAKEGANLPPIAEDDWVTRFPAFATHVQVPVLDNDDDIDGPRTALQVEWIPDDSGHGAEWDPDTRTLRVELGDRPRQLAYRVTDAGGASAIAFVHVPPAGDQAPYAKDGIEDISITGGTQQEIDLTQYIEDAEGQPIRITAAIGVSASPQPGVTVVDGSVQATSLTLAADPAYVGPGTLVVEVTDGPPDTNEGRTAAVTLNVTVTPAEGRFPIIACPPILPRAGAPAIVVDLRTCVAGLTPLQREALTFTDPSGAPNGVSVERDGVKLKISAARNAVPGTSGTLRFGIGGPWGDMDAEMTVRVQPAALAKANADEIERADAGKETTIDVTKNDTNPFPGERLRVLGVTVVEGDVEASVADDEATVRITPRDGFYGIALLDYRLQDALDDPERIVRGRIVVHVIARPDAPSAPREVSVGANRAVITWVAPDPNGAQIDEYQVMDQSGRTYDCRRSTTCELTGLTNGTGYRFQVRARNVVDWSDWSPQSSVITPDERPDQPAAPTTVFGDTQITVSWTAPVSRGTAIVEYTVERSPGGPDSVKVVRATQTSVVFTGLQNGVEYAFRVQARNGAPTPSDWSPWSAPEAPAGPPLTAAAPTAAGVANPVGQQIRVQWVPPADNGAVITSYTLTVIPADAAPYTIPVGGDQTQIVVNGVRNGVDYRFTIAATNKAGTSAPSPQSAAVRAHGQPDQITQFTVTDHDASNHGFDGRVQYSITPPDDNGMAISRYEFDLNDDGAPDYSNASASGFVTGLTNGTVYDKIRVRACNDMCGSYSGTAPAVRPYGQPNRPGASASAVGQTQINFSWSVPALNGRELDYLEYRIGSGAWQRVDPAANGSTSRTGLAPSTSLTIFVRVVDTTGWASPEASASATTASPPPATLRVYRGLYRTPDADCSHSSCGFIFVEMSNFSPNTTYQVVIYDDRTGRWGQFNATTDGNGHWQNNSGWYYGYQGNQVWVTAGGVTSPPYTWPP